MFKLDYYKISLIILFLSSLLTAQNNISQSDLFIIKSQNQYTIENITVSDGLYNNYIHDILQDNLGFLWFASDIGLQKYDGYTFKLYTPDSSDVTQQKAFRLYEDKNFNLWVQMGEGLIRYRREFDDFVKYYFLNVEDDTIPYHVSAMAEDLDSTLWVWIENKGLYKVNFEKRIFIPQTKINNWFQNIINPIILKEGDQKETYETWIKFPAGHYGLNLQYKFAIKRKNGNLEWETNPNPDDPKGWGNRFLTLSGDTIILPVESFNSSTETKQRSIKNVRKSTLKSTFVKFRLKLSNIENPLLKGETIELKGDRFPLMWNEDIIVAPMIFDVNNKLWIAIGASVLIQFNPATNDIIYFVANSGTSGGISSNLITTAVLDEKGDLWLGGLLGLNKYSPENNSFEKYVIDTANDSSKLNIIHRMTIDGQGNIWTVANDVKGIGCFNKLTKEYIHYSRGMDNWIDPVATDRSGIIWLGNLNQGVSKLDPNPKKFSTFSIKQNEIDILEGKNILAVYEDKKGEIWLGGDLGGLYRYNRQTGKISVYRIGNGIFDSQFENYIMDVFQDSKGNFWVGTTGGLCRFNSKTGEFKHLQQPHSIYHRLGRVGKIREDLNGKLWLITRNGDLVHFNPNTEETKYFRMNDSQRSFSDFILDPHGYLWVGSAESALRGGEGGVLKFDISQNKLSNVEQLERFDIISLCLDDEILWCGTSGSGLIRYDTKADTKTIINKFDGLLSNTIQGLEQDESGNLWISSARGLTKYDPQKETFNHYFKKDGFFTNEFTYRAHSKSENGEMIFGSLHGVVTFYPDSINNSEYMPPIVLTDLKIQNESVGVGGNSPLKKHISVSDKIELAHDQNDITISFASLDYKHPGRITYSFYLKNFEGHWRTPGSERRAYYTNLDPGEYVFIVKGTNSDGVWNETGTSIKIIILPPWWATWWAYTIYAFVFVALIYFIRRYELNRQNLKHGLELERVETEKYQEIDRMKSLFFANISHEFRTPLTLIKGPVQQMLSGKFTGNIKQQYQMILRNTNRLMQLINQLLDLSKVDSGEMVLRTSLEDIAPLVNGLTQSFESLAKQKNIDLKFSSSNEKVEAYIDRDKFEKIIINLLSNAFKFTPDGGFVSVDINSVVGKVHGDNDSVEILISNSGEGISSDKIDKIFDRFYQADDSSVRNYEGTGIGLSLTKELVELHHGNITVASDPGKITTFTVYFPLGNKHLLPEEIIADARELTSESQIDSIDIEPIVFTEPEEKIITGHLVKASPTLLIVEDNYDMRMYMRESLESNYKIVEAENGEEGIKQAFDHSPDIIISDVMMPKMDGFQFCAEIKKDERTSHIPVILLTAKASGESKIEGLETGADDYLTKPFDNKELQVRIKNLINQRRKLQEKFRKEFTVTPRDITVTSIDEKLVQKAIDVVESNISNQNFDTFQMAKEVGVSRMLLNTKLKALTGLSTGEFIRTLRLKRAAQLLQQGHGNVTQVAYDVGFQSLSYFAKAFREQFGQSPSQYSFKNVNNPNQ